jgi:hypothetical protein
MTTSIDRRIRRLEERLRNRGESDSTIAEIIRERRRKRLLAEGKDQEPRLSVPFFDEMGRPLKISEFMRQARLARLAREQAKNSPDRIDRRRPGSTSPDLIK